MNNALQDLTEENFESDKYDGVHLFEVSGDGISSEVPLTDYMGQGYKIKLNIGGVESYFLLDTGASNIIIDRKIERELLLSGSIKREDYLDESNYIMANNESVVAQNIILREIKVGNYTVKNVKAAIIDGGSLLCGQSFLESFSKWEINKFKKTLTLFR
jgi:clan AA aspartic protease (TIGR02281 family)